MSAVHLVIDPRKTEQRGGNETREESALGVFNDQVTTMDSQGSIPRRTLEMVQATFPHPQRCEETQVFTLQLCHWLTLLPGVNTQALEAHSWAARSKPAGQSAGAVPLWDALGMPWDGQGLTIPAASRVRPMCLQNKYKHA